ncbi:MAG TPA: VOC family protein [Solirubrobacteraceae bacterium]|jgi:glyoxalase family protein|nr:VOC family protein [Solirubrobacteraceae bacterium]
MQLEGIHHVTCVTADAPSNADFYVRVMGLRIVKKSINQTDQTTYHIFYGDERASYGNNISFFEYRGRPDGRAGAGNVHRIAWRLGSEEALDFWERRIADEDLETQRGESWLRFADHEGLEHELAVVRTDEPPLTGEAPDIPGENAIQGLDGFRAFARDQDASVRFLIDELGFAQTGETRFEARGAERSGWYQLDPAPAERRRFGGGVVQHVAWGCHAEDIEDWWKLLVDANVGPTEVIDRHFFRSVYFTEPGGVLFEIAERGGPGFIVDEPDAEHMGDRLTLPPWLEERRQLYEWSLSPVPTTAEIRARAGAEKALAK